MAFEQAQAFVVILPHYYGKGSTLAEARQNAIKAGFSYPRGKRKIMAQIVAIAAAPEDVRIEANVGVNVYAPNGTTAVKWEMEI